MGFKNKSGKESSGFLSIKYHSHDLPIRKYLIDGGGRTEKYAIKKAEDNLLDSTVEWAVLYINNEIQHYYHHKSKGGIKHQIGKNEYRLCLSHLKFYSLWIVPTPEARREGMKAARLNEIPANEIEYYDTKDVAKIEIYLGGKLVGTRQKGGYL